MKKLLVILLSLCMLVSSLAACTSGSGPSEGGESTPKQSIPNETPNGTTPVGESTPPESTTEEKVGNLDPDIDLGGKEVVIISRNDPWMIDEVSVEKTTGDPINDAIFQRNLNVESMLNMEINNFLTAGTTDYTVIDALKNTAGPDCPYHIAASPAYTCFDNTATGLFHNLYDISHIDLDQEYWSPKYNKEASIGNAQYFGTGAISLSLRRFIFVTFFNKDLAENYGLEDLYQVVNDKRWTIEYQAGLVGNMYMDMDGIQGQTVGDMYGFVSEESLFVDPYVAASDIRILTKDDDNFLAYDPDIERADNMMQQIYNLYYRSGGSYIFIGDGVYSQFDKILNKFTSGEATMMTHRLIVAESQELRGMDSEYGIIPIPKLEEDQPEYYSLAHDLFTVFGVVSSVNSLDLDNIGAVMEAMAIESHKVVTPAYYEVALKGKYSKDPESWEMLDMIMNNLKINGGLLYAMKTGVTAKFRDAVANKNSNTNIVFSALNNKAVIRNITALNTAISNMQG